MQISLYPQRTQWQALTARPALDYSGITQTVQTVLDKVKAEGDVALRAYNLQFDKVELNDLQVSPTEFAAAEAGLDEALKTAIRTAAKNIHIFHAAQQHELPQVETTPGVRCWQKSVPIEKVGLYIPGGTAPLFSTVLMLAVPARIAGCEEIVLCTPPDKNGSIHPAILYAAQTAGVHKVFKVGGAQAIAAMAYGTESIPHVYKIFGPGNPFVTVAKQLVSLSDVAIDMPAGPSEVAVVADSDARPKTVAADMLSQAEHGTTSQAMVFTTDPALAQAVQAEVQKQFMTSPRQQYLAPSLENSRIIVLKDWAEVMELCNLYAPEHLILSTRNYRELAAQVHNAGSVFLGYNTPESAGDYASGTNHTLPTHGYARAYSGVNLDSYLKKITFQEITENGLHHLRDTICIMAQAECLEAHKYAVTVRLEV